MAEIVNLRIARKRKARDAEGQASAENRARFGRAKSEKARDDTTAENAARQLDQHRIVRDEER